MRVKNRVVLAIAASALMGGSAFATDLPPYEGSVKDAPVAASSKFELNASVGVKNGEANEFVYNADGSKLSQLIWKYNNDMMVNAGASWTPLRWLTLGVKGSINSDAGGGSTMDDWDWGVAGCPGGICHSHHEDTKLRRASTVDVFAAGTFLRSNGITMAGLVGYKWDYSKWQAYGGYANYYGELPPTLGLTYEQSWDTPYIGLQAKAELGRWSLGGKVIGSWWVNSEDTDHHHWRDLAIKGNPGSTNMIGASAEIGYQFTSALGVSLTYDYTQFDTAKGNATYSDTATGQTLGVAPHGADNTSQTISLGVNYKF